MRNEPFRRKNETQQEFLRRVATHQRLCVEWADYHKQTATKLAIVMRLLVKENLDAADRHREALEKSVMLFGAQNRGVIDARNRTTRTVRRQTVRHEVAATFGAGPVE